MSLSLTLKGPSPWGFRITGGRDFLQPISVSKVVTDGRADLAGLQNGDIIVAINGERTSEMINMEAQSKIRQCRGSLLLAVDRPEPGSPRWMNGSPSAERFQSTVLSRRDENQNLMDISSSTYSLGTSSSTGSLSPRPSSPASPVAQLRSVSPGYSTMYSAPSWGQRVMSDEQLYVQHQGVKVMPDPPSCRSQSPVYSSVAGGRTCRSETYSPGSPPSSPGSNLSASSLSTARRLSDSQSLRRVDKESEVYKMIQENRELRSNPRQSNRFRALQKALERDERAAAAEFPGCFSPPPVPGVPRYRVCEQCDTAIVTEAVRITEGRYRHPGCYVCQDCGLNLKMRGHFWVGDELFCEKHAQERSRRSAAIS
ncbi:PDZ and LIM domain protein 2 [Callorhinchus milii]|uniref:PDZ and LIM domain protein 2 n=2 Tax=Callorhinchus milii TaxID=7868 RepID=A0A4W3IKR7_CALMI|nr:PDZ and LIM domain protein 2 [Callorhinchus milii]|eukprot:gi/632977865/ref/XP_007905585.1/ PREDICTED: PDZ and LIM domain protein 2 [Callorhinchus milii]